MHIKCLKSLKHACREPEKKLPDFVVCILVSLVRSHPLQSNIFWGFTHAFYSRSNLKFFGLFWINLWNWGFDTIHLAFKLLKGTGFPLIHFLAVIQRGMSAKMLKFGAYSISIFISWNWNASNATIEVRAKMLKLNIIGLLDPTRGSITSFKLRITAGQTQEASPRLISM